ncbi:MAG: PEP-CTERM sorting domain-containing protein [Fibrella sp.]|nr:PEP-CTERM sorting domain-containing protein [Armatimonadota bacterium]
MRNSMKRAITAITLGVALISAISAKDANAFLDLNLVTGPTDIGGGLFTYLYDVDLISGFNVTNNQDLTLFDVLGIQSASFTKIGAYDGTFAVSLPATGENPIIGFTDTFIPNVNLNYTGSSIVGPATGSPNLNVGQLLVTSTAGVLQNGANPFSAVTQDKATLNNSFAQSTVDGPGVAIVPEAGTMALLATGLLGMVGVGLRRRATK